MAREGQFSFNGTWNNEYHWYSISLQVMPWLEASIRYTLVQDLLYSGDLDFSGDNELADKGIDFKVRLLKESRYIPEVSLGFRDFGGTGLFDGEFLAATKRFGPLDATVGIGWGYLGQSGNISNLCVPSPTGSVLDHKVSAATVGSSMQIDGLLALLLSTLGSSTKRRFSPFQSK
ncbi:putative outer membrane lipoprotein ymcA [Vibrio ishigakensis]|uniref:Putative outer membrane lipoprotein ymcA n=1 Tax=Vibrio ishigakensis TaxID=1481914 RepID=A0A0B8NQ36_9VIBR|nr:putative outer membrane lipoprotein ymcA [Vibrio ishigakensis]